MIPKVLPSVPPRMHHAGKRKRRTQTKPSRTSSSSGSPMVWGDKDNFGILWGNWLDFYIRVADTHWSWRQSHSSLPRIHAPPRAVRRIGGIAHSNAPSKTRIRRSHLPIGISNLHLRQGNMGSNPIGSILSSRHFQRQDYGPSSHWYRFDSGREY